MYDERQSVSPGLNRTSISGPLYGQRGTCNKSLMSPQALSENIPTALLTLDFTIARSNFAFSDALSLPPDVEGQPLKDLVISSEKAKIQRLQNSLRIELQDKAHPSSLHASPHDINFISAIEPRDLYGATAGFQARSEYWTFRLPRERSRGFPISICLAKSSVYFIMLTLVSSASPMVTIPSPVSQGSGTQSLASPVSVHSTRSPSLERILDRTRRSGTSHGKLAYHSQSTSSALYQTSHTSHGHYPHNSPSQSYDSASSPHGSTDTSKSSTHGRDDSHEDLRHLQLPPIRTNNIGESTAPASFKIATSMGKQSPSKIHPANSKRDKRRRVDIHEMLR
ncbi:hypothetical protein MMC20_000205 [Loxospora ochrophaea]|nr:hypothetical protein [Loxospora ochrophaea]